jgi:two-component system NtrC family sensor kinase
MTDHIDNLGLRLGAILLVLATLGAVAFGAINFQQRMAFDVPEDGASWVDHTPDVQALYVAPNSAAERAGIKVGDDLVAINGVPIHRSVDVAKRLWALGVWSQAHYALERHGRQFEALVVVAPAAKPLALENYLRAVGLVYLFIGFFIFARRWSAPRAVHFYVFCLVSAVMFSFHYTGKLNGFDWEVYWCQVGAFAPGARSACAFRVALPGTRKSTTILAPSRCHRSLSGAGRPAGDPRGGRHQSAGFCAFASGAHRA